MSSWLGKSGSITDPAQYLGMRIDTGTVANFPQNIAAFFFNTTAITAADDLVFSGRYQGFTSGPTPKPVESDSNQPGQITIPFFALPFSMGRPPAAPVDNFLVVPASYTVSGSGTFDSIVAGPTVGQTAIFTGSINLAPYTTSGAGVLLALGGTSKFTGSLTVHGQTSVAGMLEIAGKANLEGLSASDDTPSHQSLLAIGGVKVDSGASLTTAGVMVGQTTTTTTPQLVVDGTLTDTDATNGLMIAVGAGQMGSLIGTAAKITSMTVTIGGMGGTGKATLDAASKWMNAATFTLGQGGTLTDAGEIDANQFKLDGTAKLNGGTLKIVTKDAKAGPGDITVQQDAVVTGSGTTLMTPLLTTQTGSTTKLTNPTLSDAGTDALDGDPSGTPSGTVTTTGTTVTVGSTSIVRAGVVSVGEAPTGSLTITGGTWTDTAAGTSLSIGASGYLSLLGGAKLNDQGVSIGNVAAGTTAMAAAAMVSQGSQWSIGGDLSIGGAGVGMLSLGVGAEGEAGAQWIGRRSYASRFLAANPGVQPVRFDAGSLGGGLPRRDLLVSPCHAMFIDGVLVPARALVNGDTVSRVTGLRRVDYVHVELETHDVLLAEGAPSESFLDDDSRGVFHNAGEFALAYPDAPVAGGFCALRVESGPALEAVRRRLQGIAGDARRAA